MGRTNQEKMNFLSFPNPACPRKAKSSLYFFDGDGWSFSVKPNRFGEVKYAFFHPTCGDFIPGMRNPEARTRGKQAPIYCIIGKFKSNRAGIPSMKAAIRRKYGSPEVIRLEEIAPPQVREDEVVIRIHATTVNRTDCAHLSARPFIMRLVLGLFRPGKIILGTDFAGEVVAMGKAVQGYSLGDRVFGFEDTGSCSQAEYIRIKAENIFPIPGAIDYQEAAASLEGAHYAYAFLQRVKIKTGNHVLINGASGAIGSALLQLLRPFPIQITATCTTKNLDRIRKLGADTLIDYTREDFIDREGHYDFIFDAVGKSSFSQCKHLLNKGGVYISSEPGPGLQHVLLPLLNPLSTKKVIFPIPYPSHQSIPFIIKHLEQGSFRPLIDRE
jgi:NADPH:quinone reductase-like Zn-dependent oxidoreductase